MSSAIVIGVGIYFKDMLDPGCREAFPIRTTSTSPCAAASSSSSLLAAAASPVRTIAAVATGKGAKATLRVSPLYLSLNSPRPGREKVPYLLHLRHLRPQLRTAGEEAQAADPVHARIRAGQDRARGGGVRTHAEQASL